MNSIIFWFGSAAILSHAPKQVELPAPTEKQLAEAKQEFKALGAKYVPWRSFPSNQVVHVFQFVRDTSDDDLSRLPNVHFPYSIEFFSGSGITDCGMKEIARQNTLVGLYLGGTKITDIGLKTIKDCTAITKLVIGNSKLTDPMMHQIGQLKSLEHVGFVHATLSGAGLKELNDLDRLVTLDFEDTNFDDLSLIEIAKLKKLEYLGLENLDVTDDGILALSKTKTLRQVHFFRTAVTNKGVEALKAALPKCMIEKQDRKPAGAVDNDKKKDDQKK